MNLQRLILTNLDRAHQGMMSVPTLWSEVALDAGAGATFTEFSKALAELEIKGQVVTIRGEDRLKAKLTDAGRGRLAEQ